MIDDVEPSVSDKVKPSVSVVVLSYNRPALLYEALASLRAQTHPACEVTVVDNPSPASEEVARVVAEFSDFKLFRSRVNLGYAAGMNRGIEMSAGEYTLITEDDIVLDRDCIRSLAEYAEGDPETGLAGPLMYNKSEGTIRCAGGDFELGGVYRMKLHGEGVRDEGQFPRPVQVTYIDGAVMFARTDFWRRLGGFREEFFMYGEAVELCAKAAKTGKRLTLVPSAKVKHFEPPPGSNNSPEFAFHRYKNLFLLYLLQAPARHMPEFLCRYVGLGLFRAAAGGSLRPFLRALVWTARRTPSMLRERAGRRNASDAPPRRASDAERLSFNDE
ncbi:MAG: glycosyltransferase family 2 protein [Pyrinomonadaceae bacterium]